MFVLQAVNTTTATARIVKAGDVQKIGNFNLWRHPEMAEAVITMLTIYFLATVIIAGPLVYSWTKGKLAARKRKKTVFRNDEMLRVQREGASIRNPVEIINIPTGIENSTFKNEEVAKKETPETQKEEGRNEGFKRPMPFTKFLDVNRPKAATNYDKIETAEEHYYSTVMPIIEAEGRRKAEQESLKMAELVQANLRRINTKTKDMEMLVEIQERKAIALERENAELSNTLRRETERKRRQSVKERILRKIEEEEKEKERLDTARATDILITGTSEREQEGEKREDRHKRKPPPIEEWESEWEE